ncbi:MAG: epoxide hydrolase [Acidimicrobiia bacterium]|nr:epoxide hydrolase [Acidimicrobiia bacterium]
MPSETRPFSLHVEQAVLDDLRHRLARTRWPDEPVDAGWSYGTDLRYVKQFATYWRDEYDWRRHETAVNALRQFTTDIGGATVHFVHEPGSGPNPFPLLLVHGWPGSVWEFNRLIPLLTDPARSGGDADDAFSVVAPSLPGYAFSHDPGQRYPVERIATMFSTLMADVLGYRRFGTQGGDWGAFVTSVLAFQHPESVTGLHLNLLPVRRDPAVLEKAKSEPPDSDTRRYLDQLNHFLAEETGYQWIQGTKPQTLAFGLNDSPAGLAAWILEKFHAWSDHQGDLDSYFGRDVLLTNIMLYWITGAVGASFWPYYARRHGPWPIPDNASIRVPMGYAEFPKEILTPPRSLAEPMFSDIRRWTRMERGGHFAALEQPALLAREIREFFRPLR